MHDILHHFVEINYLFFMFLFLLLSINHVAVSKILIYFSTLTQNF